MVHKNIEDYASYPTLYSLMDVLLPDWIIDTPLDEMKAVERGAAVSRIEKANKVINQITEQFIVFYDTLITRKESLQWYNDAQRATYERQVSDVLWHAPTIRVGATTEIINLRANGSTIGITSDHVLGRKFVGSTAVQMMESGTTDPYQYYKLFVEGLKVILCTQSQNLKIARFQGNNLDPYQEAAANGVDVAYITTDVAYMTKKRVVHLAEEIAAGNIPTHTTTKEVINFDALQFLET